MNRQELENRLINFSLRIIEIVNSIKTIEPGIHLSRQLGRSGTSVALNYGEACEAESRKDFIHKMKIVLKELRETHICLRIIKDGALHRCSISKLDSAILENDELISIFVKSVNTARKNGGR
jgi:four helix bundle protein